jgi:hypothetical protein
MGFVFLVFRPSFFSSFVPNSVCNLFIVLKPTKTKIKNTQFLSISQKHYFMIQLLIRDFFLTKTFRIILSLKIIEMILLLIAFLIFMKVIGK